MSSRVIAQLLALSLAAGMVQSKRVNGVNAGSGGSLEASVNDKQLAGDWFAAGKICTALNDMPVSHDNYELKVLCQQEKARSSQYAYTVMVSDTVKENSQVIFKPASPHIRYGNLGSQHSNLQVATEVSLWLGEGTPADLTGNPLTDLMGDPSEGRKLCLIAPLEAQLQKALGLPGVTGYKVGVLKLAFCNPMMESGHAVPQMKKTASPPYIMEIDAEHPVEFK